MVIIPNKDFNPRHMKVYVTTYLILTKEFSALLKYQKTRVFRFHNLVKKFTKFYYRSRTSFVNINQHSDILCVQVFHGECFMLIFLKNVIIHLKTNQTFKHSFRSGIDKKLLSDD